MTDTAYETPISKLASRAIALMQGGACIRIVPENDPSFSSHTFSAPVVALISAALADAAATTPAEQAGDVRQAVRVKPLVWHNYDAWTWWAESTSGTYRVQERNGTWLATLNLPMTEHVIYEYETDGTPNDFEAAHLACQADHTARITAALEPDPTPALGWRAMQTAAAEAVAKEAHGETVLGGQRFKTVKLEDAVDAIRALPGPTAEQALAEAVKLPEVQAMRTALQTLRNLMCEAFEDDDGNSGCGLCENDCTGCIAHFALAKIGEAK